MGAQGENAREVVRDVFEPTFGTWAKTKTSLTVLVKPPIDRLAWPEFDMLPDGRFVYAPIEIRETGLWAIDLTYKEN